jgi:DNA-binding NtrC family response regulator
MNATNDPCVAADSHLAFVIDDDASVRQFIAASLAQMGVNVKAFQTAKEALSALTAGHPAIVFLDVALLQSDALDVIRGLSERQYQGVVQLMSGGRQSLLEAVQRIGVRHRLSLAVPIQKPLASETIAQVVASLGSPTGRLTVKGDAAQESAVPLSPSSRAV